MKKLIVVLSLVCSYSFGIDKYEIYEKYKNHQYLSVCKIGKVFYKGNSNDEELLSLIGDSCARVDYINPLGAIIKKLVSTPKFRQNASYFATILLQKKLIYQFMNDHIDLKNLRLPRTSHILSIVFENLVKHNYTSENDIIEIILKNKMYKLWLSKDKPKKVYIEEYNNNKLIKRHWYL